MKFWSCSDWKNFKKRWFYPLRQTLRLAYIALFSNFRPLWTICNYLNWLVHVFVRYSYTWKSPSTKHRMWRKNRRPSAQLLLRSSLPRQFWPGTGIPSFPGKNFECSKKNPMKFYSIHTVSSWCRKTRAKSLDFLTSAYASV